MAKKQHVIVTTQHRGIFFGELDGEISKERVVLKGCRNVVYWSRDIRGFVGLATSGPGPGSKVGPAARRATLFGITGVLECEPEAVKRFEEAPWG